MKCLICGGKNFVCIHKGTRDIPQINVMKCQDCGMVQLDSDVYNTAKNYEGGHAERGLCGADRSSYGYVVGDLDTGDKAG